MLKIYFLISLRRFAKDKFYNIVNILGLALGISVCLILIQFVIHERTFDSFHSHAPRIYAVNAKLQFGGNEVIAKKMSARFGPSLKESSEDVEDFVRMKAIQRVSLTEDRSNVFYEDNFIFADPAILSIFSFRLLQGNKSTALSEVNTLLITPDMSRKYFGDSSPLGKTLLFNNQIEFKVVGLIEAAPSNSSIQYSFIASFSSVPQIEQSMMNSISSDIPYTATYIGAGAYETYVLLSSDSEIEKVRTEQMIPTIIKQSGGSLENSSYFLLPIAETHAASGKSRYTTVLVPIGLIILTLALLNFVSLSSAKSLQRSKEAGIKKVFGANSRDLNAQVHLETWATVLFAFFLSFGFIELIRDYILPLIGISIDSKLVYSAWSIFSMIFVLVLSALLASSYPAFLFSSIKPMEAFKGKTSPRGTAIAVQKYFIIFQFTVTVILVACSLIVYKQLNFLRNHDLGVRSSNVIAIPMSGGTDPVNNYSSLRDLTSNLASVEDVSAASLPLFKSYTTSFATKSLLSMHDITINAMSVSDNFMRTFDLRWTHQPDDSQEITLPGNVLLNQKAIEALQLSDDPIGKSFVVSNETFKVVGVLKDFHYSSLHRSIEPLMLSVVKDSIDAFATTHGCLFIKFHSSADLGDNVQQVGKIFKSIVPDKPFDFYFIDEALEDLYVNEVKTSRLFTTGASIAILLAIMGLFSFCTYVIETKIREIGIRKSLGASFSNIVSKLIYRFISPLFISMLIGIPIAWYLMHSWLRTYPYKAALNFNLFVIAALCLVVVAILTVVVKSIKAAMTNPAEIIREN